MSCKRLLCAATLGALAVLSPARAQSAADLRTIAQFVECRLDDKQIERFIARVDTNAVPGLTNQQGKPGAIDLGWETQKPIHAWGVQSTVVALPSPRAMLMALPAPRGGEIDAAKRWADRIGGMHEDQGVISMREHMNWRGVDYRKAGGGREIRLLVDQKETPGWVLLGCMYHEKPVDNP